MKRNKLTRRQLLRLSALAGTGAVIAACAPSQPSAPAAPAAPAATEPPAAGATEAPAAATEAPAATAAPTAVPSLGGELKPIPRNQTLILGWGSVGNVGVMNPWASAGYNHQAGLAVLWEPLFYYAIFADKEVPWLAESGTYNADFTELTIKLRKDAMWSDGKPVTSADVAFNFDTNMKNDKLGYHAQFKEFVKEVKTPDEQTVVVTFNRPSPRFKFEALTQKFDTGIEMVPAHALENESDVNAFNGGIDMPHSGPYSIVNWTVDQVVMDYRDDWWAAKSGLAPVPEVKRVIVQRIGADMGTVAQRVVNNEFDATLDMRNALIKSTLEQNPKVTSHTGNEPPHGYLDWWPNSLWVNTQIEPFNDPNVRKAISLSINRDQLDEVVYEGAKVATIYPFPLYPQLVKFAESDGVKALEEKYQPRKFDVDEAAKLLEGAGFAKNADGLWEKGGNTIPGTINGFEGIHSDIVPILVEQLKNAGIDASINFGPDGYQNMADGKPGFYMFGHGAGLIDPQATFDLYHSRYAQPIGTPAGNNRFSRYNNPDYDKIVDEMASLPSDDPKFQELAVQAMEIYWKDMIDIPVIQWLHRIPYNQTYWTNWPTEANVADGYNGAFWHYTAPQFIMTLKATNA
jgi:ABC-type transport system substrate-binding protein